MTKYYYYVGSISDLPEGISYLWCKYYAEEKEIEIRNDFNIHNSYGNEFLIWDIDEEWLIINKLKGELLIRNVEGMLKNDPT